VIKKINVAEKKMPNRGLTATSKAFGLTRGELARIGDRAMTSESVRKYIGCANVRRLNVEILDDKNGTIPPSRFRVTLYDDANHRAILLDGSLCDPRLVDIVESALSPTIRPMRVGVDKNVDQRD
jgi:hypothetical protein